MAEGGQLRVGRIIAPCTGIVGVPADLRAGRRLCLTGDQIMAQRVKHIGFGLSAPAAGEQLLSVLRAGRRSGDRALIPGVPQRFKLRHVGLAANRAGKHLGARLGTGRLLLHDPCANVREGDRDRRLQAADTKDDDRMVKVAGINECGVIRQLEPGPVAVYSREHQSVQRKRFAVGVIQLLGHFRDLQLFDLRPGKSGLQGLRRAHFEQIVRILADKRSVCVPALKCLPLVGRRRKRNGVAEEVASVRPGLGDRSGAGDLQRQLLPPADRSGQRFGVGFTVRVADRAADHHPVCFPRRGDRACSVIVRREGDGVGPVVRRVFLREDHLIGPARLQLLGDILRAVASDGDQLAEFLLRIDIHCLVSAGEAGVRGLDPNTQDRLRPFRREADRSAVAGDPFAVGEAVFVSVGEGLVCLVPFIIQRDRRSVRHRGRRGDLLVEQDVSCGIDVVAELGIPLVQGGIRGAHDVVDECDGLGLGDGPAGLAVHKHGDRLSVMVLAVQTHSAQRLQHRQGIQIVILRPAALRDVRQHRSDQSGGHVVIDHHAVLLLDIGLEAKVVIQAVPEYAGDHIGRAEGLLDGLLRDGRRSACRHLADELTGEQGLDLRAGGRILPDRQLVLLRCKRDGDRQAVDLIVSEEVLREHGHVHDALEGDRIQGTLRAVGDDGVENIVAEFIARVGIQRGIDICALHRGIQGVQAVQDGIRHHFARVHNAVEGDDFVQAEALIEGLRRGGHGKSGDAVGDQLIELFLKSVPALRGKGLRQVDEVLPAELDQPVKVRACDVISCLERVLDPGDGICHRVKILQHDLVVDGIDRVLIQQDLQNDLLRQIPLLVHRNVFQIQVQAEIQQLVDP